MRCGWILLAVGGLDRQSRVLTFRSTGDLFDEGRGHCGEGRAHVHRPVDQSL
jgi:hypothetical protein